MWAAAILSHETKKVEQATGRHPSPAASRAGRDRHRRPGAVRRRPRACDRWRGRARRAPERLRLGRPQQGHRPRPDRARDGSGRRPARCPRERRDEARADASVARGPAGRCWRRRRARREAADRRSRRGASSRWRRCRTSTSSSTWAIASRRAGVHATGPASRSRSESLLGQRQAGAGDARATTAARCCAAWCWTAWSRRRALGLKLGKDFLAVDVSIDPGRGRQAARRRRRSACSAGRQRQRRPTGRSGRRSADGGAAARAARRRGRLPLQVRPDQQAVRARRGRVRADARRRRSPATSTASTTRPATSAWRWSRRAAAASAPRSTRC